VGIDKVLADLRGPLHSMQKNVSVRIKTNRNKEKEMNENLNRKK